MPAMASKERSTSRRFSLGLSAAVFGVAFRTPDQPTPIRPWGSSPVRKRTPTAISFSARRFRSSARSPIFSSRPLVSETRLESLNQIA